MAVNFRSYRQGREREQGHGEKNIEVEREVQKVEVPWFGAIQIRTTGGVGEYVILHDVPEHCSGFAIEV
jgi:hypothetical protein